MRIAVEGNGDRIRIDDYIRETSEERRARYGGGCGCFYLCLLILVAYTIHAVTEYARKNPHSGCVQLFTFLYSVSALISLYLFLTLLCYISYRRSLSALQASNITHIPHTLLRKYRKLQLLDLLGLVLLFLVTTPWAAALLYSKNNKECLSAFPELASLSFVYFLLGVVWLGTFLVLPLVLIWLVHAINRSQQQQQQSDHQSLNAPLNGHPGRQSNLIHALLNQQLAVAQEVPIPFFSVSVLRPEESLGIRDVPRSSNQETYAGPVVVHIDSSHPSPTLSVDTVATEAQAKADQPTIPGSTLFSMLDVVPMSEENLANLGLSRSGGFDTTDFSVATTTHTNRPPARAPASPAEQNIQRPSSPNSNV